jgi:hypothetical protein
MWDYKYIEDKWGDWHLCRVVSANETHVGPTFTLEEIRYGRVRVQPFIYDACDMPQETTSQ